jgi:hypothetical protein
MEANDDLEKKGYLAITFHEIVRFDPETAEFLKYITTTTGKLAKCD